MDDLTRKNKASLSKSAIATYVHDIEELEKHEFTLRKTVDECLNEVRYLQQKSDRDLQNRERDYESLNNKYLTIAEQKQQMQAELNKEITMKREIEEKRASLKLVSAPLKPVEVKGDEKLYYYDTGKSCLFALLRMVVFLCLFALGACLVQDDSDFPIFFTIYISASIIFLIINIFRIAYVKKQEEAEHNEFLKRKKSYETLYQNYCKKLDEHREYLDSVNAYTEQLEKSENTITRWNKKISEADQNLNATLIGRDNAKKALETAEIEKKNSILKIALIKKTAEFLDIKAEEILKQKQELYEFGIIPPDYRMFDCVLQFDQIFRNDLADTMREAVKIYEERVFRNEIVRGIDRIYNMLLSIRDTMYGVGIVLSSIKNEVHLMSQNIASIAEDTNTILRLQEESNCLQAEYSLQLEKNNRVQKSLVDEERIAMEAVLNLQKDLIDETRASRYATEAIRESNRKYEWYMEQHRNGIF
ncbi:MAG: hypothetical protein E7603_01085 [Ruminococcaceae bacterium]|nr:hypothetical protein [Oscillospiraceae bacterium]